jgi:CheY-like chemotaxis protein|tara:strand:+ start:1211 stop:1588 length:378 start_codon:yes stop_codon:yes gene_type:complete
MIDSILIIDDEEDMCWAISHILKSQGQAIVTASSGKEACEKLLEGCYSLVFLDAKMPDMDGLEVARFANRVANGTPKIIMISGYHYANDPIICNALEEGLITGFLSKPFTNEEILLHYNAHRNAI